MNEKDIATLLTAATFFVLGVAAVSGVLYGFYSIITRWRRKKRLKVALKVLSEGGKVLTFDKRGIPVVLEFKDKDGRTSFRGEF